VLNVSAARRILPAAIEGKYVRNVLIELRPIRFAAGMLLY